MAPDQAAGGERLLLHYIRYEAVWRRHIQPELGNLRAGSVTVQVVEAFTRSLYDRKLSIKTIRGILIVLRSVLSYAEIQGVEVRPIPPIRCPKGAKKLIRVLSREEQDRLVAYLSQDMDCCRFGVLLALFTGIRLGELCALRWKDVLLTERVIYINATMQRLKVLDGDSEMKTHVVISTPKTEATVRVIPMSDHVAALCRHMSGFGPACFVLTGTERYMEPRAVQFRMEKYAKDCGLEGVHFHTLHHTFAPRSVEVGFGLKSLSEILGHSDTSYNIDCGEIHDSQPCFANSKPKL